MSSAGLTNSSRRARAWASCTSEPACGYASPSIRQLHPPDGFEHRRVAQRAVAGEEHLLAGCLQVGREVVRRCDRRRRDALHAAGRLAVAGVEDLTSARVERAHDEARRVPEREGQEVEAGDSDHRQAAGVRQRLAGRHADTQAGEHAWAEVDGDGADLAQLDAALPAQELDGGREGLGVAAPTAGVDGAEHPLVPTDRAPDLGGGGGDAEDEHQAPEPQGDTTPATASARGAHAGPTAWKAR